MKNIVFALILISTTISCKDVKQKNPFSSFSYNSKGIVKLNISNCDSNSYTIVYNSLIPVNQFVQYFTVISDTLIELKIETGFPTVVHLIQQNGYVDFLVLPNDTIDVFVNHNDSLDFSQTVTYSGETALMSDFLSKERLNFQNIYPSKLETPENYFTKIDSVTEIALKKLYDFTNKVELPEWFIKYQETDILFLGEYLKLHQYKQRFWSYNQIIKKDTKVSKELKNLLTSNKFFTENYVSFLSEIHTDKYDTLASPQYATNEILINNINNNIEMVNNCGINNKLISYYIVSRLSFPLMDKIMFKQTKNEFLQYSIKMDSLFNKNNASVIDSSILSFINEYKTTQYQKFINRNLLKKGDKAPDFFLEDINGLPVKLSDLKGKTVLLNFWGTYCIPCIKSIPKKNTLVKKYNSDNFVLVNICIDDKIKLWKELITKNNFGGVHLKCNDNWYNLLKDKYLLNGIPHYTLIDKNGFIIKNEIPMDSLENYIDINI